METKEQHDIKIEYTQSLKKESLHNKKPIKKLYMYIGITILFLLASIALIYAISLAKETLN